MILSLGKGPRVGGAGPSRERTCRGCPSRSLGLCLSLDAPGTARSCPSPPVLVSGHPTEPGAGPAHARVGIVTSAGCHITDSPPYYLPEPTGKFWEARPGHEQVWTLCCREPATRPSASGSEYRSTPRAGRAEWLQPARSVQWTWRSTRAGTAGLRVEPWWPSMLPRPRLSPRL